MLDWGSPPTIQHLSLAGDALTTGNRHIRAVLIDGTPDEIWPWLLQMGQDRGGFYSYEWLENIFRADMHNIYELRSELQHPRVVGDTVWLAGRHHYNGTGYQRIGAITPHQSFVMVDEEDYTRLEHGRKAKACWAFYLHPQSNSKTWLIAGSYQSDGSPGRNVLRYFFYEVPHFIMERKMLRTIKRLVEQNKPIEDGVTPAISFADDKDHELIK